LDANNLYGTAMSEPLPIGNFRFLSDQKISDWMRWRCRFTRQSRQSGNRQHHATAHTERRSWYRIGEVVWAVA